MAAANSEEYEKWMTSLQLITNRFGMATGTSTLNGNVSHRRASVERGASVPCLPASASAMIPNVASQPTTLSAAANATENDNK